MRGALGRNERPNQRRPPLAGSLANWLLDGRFEALLRRAREVKTSGEARVGDRVQSEPAIRHGVFVARVREECARRHARGTRRLKESPPRPAGRESAGSTEH